MIVGLLVVILIAAGLSAAVFLGGKGEPSTVTRALASTTSASTSTAASTPTATATTTTTTTARTTTTSTSSGWTVLTVNSLSSTSSALSGYYVLLYQAGAQIAAGYTPAQFKVVEGQTYSVEVQGAGGWYFQYWLATGSVDEQSNVTIRGSQTTVSAVLCDGPPGTCPDPAPLDGITVYAHRISAPYWAPCFASNCSAGTGPGASMHFVLTNSTGGVLQSVFANEQGYTFMGLTPGVTYYVDAQNCDLCHGSTHDVVFQNWGGGNTTVPIEVRVGGSLNAYYSCTNGCTGV